MRNSEERTVWLTGDDLRSWRKSKSLTQFAAAEVLGVSRRGLQQWEAGRTRIPKSIALAIAAVCFNLPSDGSLAFEDRIDADGFKTMFGPAAGNA